MTHVPEDMTPGKLRYIADWLDIFDKITQSYIDLLNFETDEAEQALYAVRKKEVQDDLRSWADHIQEATHE